MCSPHVYICTYVCWDSVLNTITCLAGYLLRRGAITCNCIVGHCVVHAAHPRLHSLYTVSSLCYPTLRCFLNPVMYSRCLQTCSVIFSPTTRAATHRLKLDTASTAGRPFHAKNQDISVYIHLQRHRLVILIKFVCCINCEYVYICQY